MTAIKPVSGSHQSLLVSKWC